jgi:hypothetical protein
MWQMTGVAFELSDHGMHEAVFLITLGAILVLALRWFEGRNR